MTMEFSIIINDTLTNVISKEDGLAADSVRCITQSTDGDYYVGTTGELSIVTLADENTTYGTLRLKAIASGFNMSKANKNGKVRKGLKSVVLDFLKDNKDKVFNTADFMYDQRRY